MRDNNKAKEITKARRKLNKATENYFRTGDIVDMFNLLEKQDMLSNAYIGKE